MALAGFGAALLSSALSAFVLDITTEAHRSRVVGVKESVLALGVLGPLLVVVASPVLTRQQIFGLAGGLVLIGAVLALLLLREPRHLAGQQGTLDLQISQQRALAAQTSLQGVVLRASESRASRLASL